MPNIAYRWLIPKVESVMKSPPRTIEGSSSVLEAVRIMTDLGIGSLIVTRQGRPIGIFTRRDLMRRVIERRLDIERTMVEEVASSPLISIGPETDLASAVELMKSKGISRLAVMRDGTLLGILTMTDIRLMFPKGYLSPWIILKRFLVDTIAYITFWSGIWTFVQIYVLKLTLAQYVANAAIGSILTMAFGGIYGRYLDALRRRADV
ncbi:MAG: L-alanine exporter AlaE [Candidatus Bathyarchaeia archaeon]